MTIEEFQTAYLRSSRLYGLLGVPVLGWLAQNILAECCLRRTLRLQRVMRELDQRAAQLEGRQC